MSENIHIVCLDAPAPPTYGGAIDMYYKIVALASTGVQVHLHYYNYNKDRNAEELAPYCKTVNVYRRKNFWSMKGLLKGLPFIVESRINKELTAALNKNNWPVLLEGTHCAGILPCLQINNRAWIRMHNNEAIYYRRLAQWTSWGIKKFYYLLESFLLHHFQRRLKVANLIFLSSEEKAAYGKQFVTVQSEVIPLFLPWQKISGPMGLGSYCLYHGNLAVSENEAAVVWLVQQVFSKKNIPLMVAGSGASHRLKKILLQQRRVQYVESPSAAQLEDLITKAHIHVLPSFNNTGVKLKLLHALFCGRHCITNKAGAAGINKGLQVCEGATHWQNKIDQLMKQPFTEEHLQQRLELEKLYNNGANAKSLNRILFVHYP